MPNEPEPLRIICIECRCRRRWWARSSEFGFRPLDHLAGRLRCNACGSRDVMVGYAERIELPPSPRDDLWATVEVWDDAGLHIQEVVARAADLGVGIAAYERAVVSRPKRNIMLRHFTRVIRSTERDAERAETARLSSQPSRSDECP